MNKAKGLKISQVPNREPPKFFCPSDLSSIPGKGQHRLSPFVRDKKFWIKLSRFRVVVPVNDGVKKISAPAPGGSD